MAADELAFRYSDMERRPGDPIQAEDWNKAMAAIAGLASAGAAPASPPAPAAGGNSGADSPWVRSAPIDPALTRAGEVFIAPGLRAVAVAGAMAEAGAGTRSETFAYVTGGGLRVLSLSGLAAPGSPPVVGAVACPDAEDIVVAGGYACIAAGRSGLVIADVRDPSRPRIAGTLALAGAARGVCVAGEVAYVVSYEQGLEIVDVADKRNPVLLSRIFIELPNTVTVAGGCAFIASDDSGYCVVDVANPASPSYVVRYAGDFSSGKGLCLRGSLAYMADGENHLIRVVDFAQPAAPRLVGSVEIDPYAFPSRLSVCGDALLVACRANAPGLYVYDLAAPERPVRVAAAGSPAWGVAADERYVYLAAESGALEVFDLRPPRLALPAGGLGIGVTQPQARLEVRGGLTLLQQEPWQGAELAPGYAEFGEGYAPVQYFRDSLGVVHLRGTLRCSAPVDVVEAGVLFTLPPTCRPEFIENHLAGASAAIGRLEIFPDGKVFLTSEGHTWLSLDGITFRAFA